MLYRKLSYTLCSRETASISRALLPWANVNVRHWKCLTRQLEHTNYLQIIQNYGLVIIFSPRFLVSEKKSRQVFLLLLLLLKRSGFFFSLLQFLFDFSKIKWRLCQRLARTRVQQSSYARAQAPWHSNLSNDTFANPKSPLPSCARTHAHGAENLLIG